ncbi:MAG: hypothetical protein ACRDNZ_15825 [Streptosporangiaceae bacterium]
MGKSRMVLGTVAEAASLADRTPRTIRYWIAAGIVAGDKLGRDLVVDLASVPVPYDESGDTNGE